MKLIRLNTKGLGLLELLIALTMASAVSLAIAQQIFQAISLSTQLKDRTDLEQAHYLASTKAKNLSFISEKLNITDSSGHRLNVELDRCLNERKKPGDDCTDFSKAPFIAHEEELPLSKSGGAVTSRIFLSLECTPTSCSKTDVRVETFSHTTSGGYDGAAGGSENPASAASTASKHRVSSYSFTGKALTSIEQIDFDCANPNLAVSSIDLGIRRANCDGFIGATQCAGSAPIHRFGVATVCPALISVACSDGVTGAGLFAGSGTCGGTPVPGPPPAIPAPPVPVLCPPPYVNGGTSTPHPTIANCGCAAGTIYNSGTNTCDAI